MTLKEFACKFDMTVNELCNLTGFSRQGLNEIIKGNSHKDSAKKNRAFLLLLKKSNELQDEEVKAAENKHIERLELIFKKF